MVTLKEAMARTGRSDLAAAHPELLEVVRGREMFRIEALVGERAPACFELTVLERGVL